MTAHEDKRLSDAVKIALIICGDRHEAWAHTIMDYIEQLRADLQAAQQQLDMYKVREENEQPCAECEAYYALQSRIDNAPEYWAVRGTGGGYTFPRYVDTQELCWTTFVEGWMSARPGDDDYDSKLAAVGSELKAMGYRAVSIRALEMPQSEQREGE